MNFDCEVGTVICPYVIKELPNHNEIKLDILAEIDKAPERTVTPEMSGYDADNINKYDWDDGYNDDRPWFQLLYPHLEKISFEMARAIGFSQTKIYEVWFQQYLNGSQHGWHVHGRNYTAVYYLELDLSSPQTEFICPMTRTENAFNVKEGDVIIFPSTLVHRAPLVQNDVRKTIISFNLDLEL